MKQEFDGLNLLQLIAELQRTGFSSEWGEAVIEAGQTASDAEFQELSILLASHDKSLRRNVAAVMAQIPNPYVTRLLVESALQDQDEEIVKVAITVLMRMRESAVDLLREIMESSTGIVHVRAALILVEIGYAEGTEALLESLNHLDALGNEDMLPRILEALGALGDPRGVAPLVEFIVGDNWLLRLVAAKALVSIGEPSVDALLDVVRNSQDWDAQCRAVEALGQIRSAQAVTPLVHLLRENKGPIQNEIINALGRIGDPTSVEALTDALGTGDPAIHFRASKALVSIGKPAVLELSRLMLEHPKSDVRRSATVALGQIGDPDAVPIIVKALSDENSLVRKAAADALGDLKDPGAVPALCQALRGENWFVVRGAADALARIGDARAVGPLLEALGDDRSEVRQQVVKALGLLCANSGQCAASVESLPSPTSLPGVNPEQVIDTLIKALGDNDPVVRNGIAHILVNMNSGYASQRLHAIVRNKDKGAQELREALEIAQKAD